MVHSEFAALVQSSKDADTETAAERSKRIAKQRVEQIAKEREAVVLTPAKEKAAKRRKLDEGQRQALEWIQDHLLTYPEKILPEKAALEVSGTSAARTRKSAKTLDTFDPKKFKVVKQLPKYFFHDALVEDCNFDTAEINLIDSGCKMTGVRFVAGFHYGVWDGTYLPSVLQGKKANIRLWLKVRRQELPGDRIAMFRESGILKDDFTLDFNNFGLWERKWGEKRVESIRYKPLDLSKELSEDVIDTTWQFGGNHLENMTYFVKGKREKKLIDWFDDCDFPKLFTKEVMLQQANRAVAMANAAPGRCLSASGSCGHSSKDPFTLVAFENEKKRKDGQARRVRIPQKGLAVPICKPE